ncbi:hypothetical protein D3C87_2180740 [compost metagenome]
MKARHRLGQQRERQAFFAALLVAVTLVRRMANQLVDGGVVAARQLAEMLEGVA